jgi:hypothetical protein
MSLTLTKQESGNFEPAPAGMHNAICVDVIDLGLVQTNYGDKDMLRIMWELPETKMGDGRPFVVSKRYNKSLHTKAALNKDLSKWRGRLIEDGESIDMTKLLGANCKLEVEHFQDGDKTFTGIGYIGKPEKKLKASGHYDGEKVRQRIAERKAKEAGQQSAPQTQPQPQSKVADVPPRDDEAQQVGDEDDVPF